MARTLTETKHRLLNIQVRPDADLEQAIEPALTFPRMVANKRWQPLPRFTTDESCDLPAARKRNQSA